MLNTGYPCVGATDTIKVIKTWNKRKRLNTLEKYNIHKMSKNGFSHE
jgi:hypothetical protein